MSGFRKALDADAMRRVPTQTLVWIAAGLFVLLTGLVTISVMTSSVPTSNAERATPSTVPAIRHALQQVAVRASELQRMQSGDTLDLYLGTQTAEGTWSWDLLLRRVTLTNGIVIGQLPGAPDLTLMSAEVLLTQAQLGYLSFGQTRGLLGLAWPEEIYRYTSTQSDNTTQSYSSSIGDYASLSVSCAEIYVVGGIGVPVHNRCDADSYSQIGPEMQNMIDQLRPADLAFNRPEEMRIGTSTIVELVLAPEAVAGLNALPENAHAEAKAAAIGLTANRVGETEVVEDIEYALRMQAKLAGLDFHIDPEGHQPRTVLPDKSVKWVWTVEPKNPGLDRVLTLTVDALLESEGQDLPPVQIRTFTERVHVTISGWDQAVSVAKDTSALHAAIAGVGTTLIAIVGWVLARRRGPQSPAPVQIVVTHKTDED